MRKEEGGNENEEITALSFLSFLPCREKGSFLLAGSPNPLQLHDNCLLINKDLTFYALP